MSSSDRQVATPQYYYLYATVNIIVIVVVAVVVATLLTQPRASLGATIFKQNLVDWIDSRIWVRAIYTRTEGWQVMKTTVTRGWLDADDGTKNCTASKCARQLTAFNCSPYSRYANDRQFNCEAFERYVIGAKQLQSEYGVNANFDKPAGFTAFNRSTTCRSTWCYVNQMFG